MGTLQPVIRVEALHKSFKKRQVLTDVSFDVHKGEVFCLLGPNGAGKSTTINILSTALRPDRGEVYFHGTPVQTSPRPYRRSLGIVPQDVAIYEEISAQANVKFFASLYGLRGKALRTNVQRALEFVGLVGRQNDKPTTFSGGMKRRLNIACAIAHDPEVIIMDEPTVGIDPQSRNHILESVKALRDAGSTIIYTSHYMEEVESISTRIVIIDDGQIIAQGTKEQLTQSLEDGRLYTVEVDESEGLQPDMLYSIDGVKRVDVKDKFIEITTVQGIENLDKIIAALINEGFKIRNLTSSVASLEMVFLNLTGRSLRN